MPDLLKYIFVFAFSASIGSFLNVCIHRIPRGTSIVTPSSKCPRCGQAIRFYDNIPIISYLLLRGSCRGCGATISIEYPTVELITALFGVLLYLSFGLGLEFFVWSVFTAALIVITFIDLHHRIIPNVISLPGIVVGLCATVLINYPNIIYGAVVSILGILTGAGILFAVGAIYMKATGKEGMGGGDVKLLAMIGAFLGWKGVLFTLFAASLVGSLVGGGIMLALGKDTKYAIPFGPFLAAGALVYLFAGELITMWYLGRFWGV